MLEVIGEKSEELRSRLQSIESSLGEIDSLRRNFHRAMRPVAELLGELEIAGTNKGALSSRVATLSAANERLGAGRDRAQSDAERLAERLSQRLQAEKPALSAGPEPLPKSVADVEASHRDARAAQAERDDESRSRTGTGAEASGQIEGLKNEVASLRANAAQRVFEVQRAESQLAALKTSFDRERNESRGLRGRIQDLEDQLAAAVAKSSEIQQAYGVIAQKLVEVESKLLAEIVAADELRSQARHDEGEHRAAMSALDTKLAVQSARAETADRLLAEARLQLRDRSADLQAVQAKLLEAETQARAALHRLAEVERELASHQAKVSELEASRTTWIERADALSNVSKMKEASLRSLEEKAASLEERLAKASDAHRNLAKDSASRTACLEAKVSVEAMGRSLAEGRLNVARRELLAAQKQIVALKSRAVGDDEGAGIGASEKSPVALKEGLEPHPATTDIVRMVS